ncbi:MAG: hypothetical protein QG597_4969 [Actinomycetota bacterium]|nr:hypothetical protein [Actinomycetota bacterium]
MSFRGRFNGVRSSEYAYVCLSRFLWVAVCERFPDSWSRVNMSIDVIAVGLVNTSTLSGSSGPISDW